MKETVVKWYQMYLGPINDLLDPVNGIELTVHGIVNALQGMCHTFLLSNYLR